MESKKTAILFATLYMNTEIDFIELQDGTIMMAKMDSDDFEIVPEKTLDDMGYFVTDPWASDTYSYQIRENVKDGYSEIDKTIPVYYCEYFVECNDIVSVSVYGYGNTPEEALNSCQHYINLLKKYSSKKTN